MSTDKIIIEGNETAKELAIKTTLLYAGSSDLKKQLEKLKITYSKITRGFKTIYVLRGSVIGRVEVVL